MMIRIYEIKGQVFMIIVRIFRIIFFLTRLVRIVVPLWKPPINNSKIRTLNLVLVDCQSFLTCKIASPSVTYLYRIIAIYTNF